MADVYFKDLVECTQDLVWVSGLTPQRLTATTKQSYYPSSNMLGNILEFERNLLKDVVQTSTTESDIRDNLPPPLSPTSCRIH